VYMSVLATHLHYLLTFTAFSSALAFRAFEQASSRMGWLTTLSPSHYSDLTLAERVAIGRLS
jgi:hypothetical protein